MSSDPYKILRRTGGAGTRKAAAAGAGTFALGLFVLALRSVGLVRVEGGALVALYTMAGLLIGAGVMQLARGIFSSGGQLAGLEDRLRDRPETIVRAWRQIRPRPGARRQPGRPPAGQHQAVVEATDGTMWTIEGSPSQVAEILRLVASRNPGAEVRGV